MTKHAFVKFADDTKLQEAINVLDSRAAIQRDLHRLEEGAKRNFMKFNKYEACTWEERTHLMIQARYQMMRSNSAENNLRISADRKLDISQQCVLAAKLISSVLPCSPQAHSQYILGKDCPPLLNLG